MTLDPTFSAAAALTTALVFTLGAVHKFKDRLKFEGALSAYELVPLGAVTALARTLPVLELAAALLVIATPTRPVGAALALVLLGTYTAAIAVNLARGRRDIDCGCGGSERETPLSGWLLFRNAWLMLIAVAALAPIGVRSLTWLDLATALAAASVFTLLYQAAEQLLANRPALSRLRA